MTKTASTNPMRMLGTIHGINAMLLIVTGLIIASVALLADLIVRSRSD